MVHAQISNILHYIFHRSVEQNTCTKIQIINISIDMVLRNIYMNLRHLVYLYWSRGTLYIRIEITHNDDITLVIIYIDVTFTACSISVEIGC